MKSIILAAGKGSRLKDITRDVPKPMLSVNGENILEHNIKWLKGFGVTDVFINLHHLPEMIRDYFEDGRDLGVNISYSYEEEIMGTGGAVRKIIKDNPHEDWNEDFFVIYGDNFFLPHVNLKELLDHHKKHQGVVTVALFKPADESQRASVVLMNRDYQITAFVEKPSADDPIREEKEIFVNAGIYITNEEVLGSVPEGFCDFGKDVFPDLLKRGIKMYGIELNDPLIAVDTVTLFEKAGGEL